MSMSIPRPGQHLPGSQPGIEPDRIHVDVDGLLTRARDAAGDGHDPAGAISRQALLLEQAHDVLVRALSTVDKV
ncbi:MAG: hypothetical protein WAX14_09590 [Rhodococcus sp. (in: high G+C Gram-positive bacteria)]|uniref:hypothetical protein n=1 Tax=Rhodococcus sp. TaxID=1831 RepID=UPI003BB5F98F